MASELSLLTLPIPPKNEEQISRFTSDSLRLKKAQSFDPYKVLKKFEEHEGREVIGIELGGDKLTTRRYIIKEKTPYPVEDVSVYYSTGGKGYLEQLEKLKERSFDVPVGISFAGPLDGEKIVAAPNMEVFLEELEQKYEKSLRKLFPSLTCVVNDAVAAIIPSVMNAALENEFLKSLVLIINGSGLGGALWYRDSSDGPVIMSAEPGHIEVVEKLNLYQQDKACGLLPDGKVCIENLAASKAGIEDIYEKKAHIHLRGFEISELYQSGENLSRNLYNTSALLVAHTYMGILHGAGITYDHETTKLALHGGTSLVPDYTQRIEQILEKDTYLEEPVEILETKSVTKHSGIMGAAIAAFAE
jgi:predicted NBD/HSP70 family sugar kinase